MPRIGFKNIVSYEDPECSNLPDPTEGDGQVTIPVLAEVKLWREKYFHIENPNDDQGNPTVGKGDDISFVLVFGNDGEITCENDEANENPSVEDTLEIQDPIRLKLMSLCIGEDYELWVVSDNGTDYQVERCHIFEPGNYTLQLRKKVDDGEATPYFDIPCHYICCVSMLFQIEFPACPQCPDDCVSEEIVNGSFETQNFDGWNVEGESEEATATVTTNGGGIPTAECGDYFALLQSNSDDELYIEQSFESCEGKRIQGYAQISVPGQIEIAKVELFDSGDTLIDSIDLKTNVYQNRWGLWQFEIPSDGEFTIRMTITGKDQGTAGSLGIDCVEII